MSIQILTATETFSTDELNRLRLHAFRAPPVDMLFLDPSILDHFVFTPQEIRSILDIEKSVYIADGDVTYIQMTYRNLECLQDTLKRHNEVEAKSKISTGIVESNEAALQLMFVFPTEAIQSVMQMYLAMYIHATKLAFYA